MYISFHGGNMTKNDIESSASLQSINCAGKLNITDRFLSRNQAERYRDRFKEGKRVRTHLREARVLRHLLGSLDKVHTILDVASGPGRFAYLLKDHCDRLFQTDYSHHMLNLSREDYPLGNRDSGYFSADAESIPLRSNSVDLVFCHRFLNHLRDPEQCGRIFSELTRVSGRYVVASCLGTSAIISPVQWAYGFFRRRRQAQDHIHIPDFIRGAIEAGLILIKRTPIRPMVMTSAFFTFVKYQD